MIRMIWKHLNLAHSECRYDGKHIEIKKNSDEKWEVFVNSSFIKTGPFNSRQEAMSHILNVIVKMIGPEYSGPMVFCRGCKKHIPLIPGVRDCKDCGTAIRRKGLKTEG